MVTNTKLYINGYDAETTWGLRLDGGDQSGYDALTAFKPLKEPVTNKNVTAQGAVVVCGTGLLDERTVSVPVHIIANSYSEFISKRNNLFNVLKSGTLNVVVKNEWKQRVRVSEQFVLEQEPEYHYETRTMEETVFTSTMYYLSCNQYTQFSMPQRKIYDQGNDTWTNVPNSGYGIAKFILSLYEPNEPTI